MQGVDLRSAMESALSDRQMSVSKLARDANVQHGDIYRWWRGETRPTRNSLARIAKALDMDASVLRQALGEPLRATQPPDEVLGALRANTKAINALAREMRSGQQETAAALRGVAPALKAVATIRTRGGS